MAEQKTVHGTKKEAAVFAAGCFWGVQALFDEEPGVIKTVVGYTGGKKEYPNPSYELVCTGKTGHAEAVQVEFDPEKLSYENLLEVFWMNHDPTTADRQGPDFGEQYRSAIFYGTEKQKKAALRSREKRQKEFKRPIVTKIVQLTEFYPAEDYHQKYYKANNTACHAKLPA
jgi:peptide-methionine (S)-S-oxide reductase